MEKDNPLGEVFASLMENPEVMNAVSSVAGSLLSQKDEDQKKTEGTTRTAPEGFSIPPELLAKLPQVMASLSSSLPSSAPDKGNDGREEPKDRSNDAKRRSLLKALKPFLSEKRCAVIDSLISLEGIAGILQGFSER